jgi:hypothetical protein
VGEERYSADSTRTCAHTPPRTYTHILTHTAHTNHTTQKTFNRGAGAIPHTRTRNTPTQSVFENEKPRRFTADSSDSMRNRAIDFAASSLLHGCRFTACSLPIRLLIIVCTVYPLSVSMLTGLLRGDCALLKATLQGQSYRR